MQMGEKHIFERASLMPLSMHTILLFCSIIFLQCYCCHPPLYDSLGWNRYDFFSHVYVEVVEKTNTDHLTANTTLEQICTNKSSQFLNLKKTHFPEKYLNLNKYF